MWDDVRMGPGCELRSFFYVIAKKNGFSDRVRTLIAEQNLAGVGGQAGSPLPGPHRSHMIIGDLWQAGDRSQHFILWRNML